MEDKIFFNISAEKPVYTLKECKFMYIALTAVLTVMKTLPEDNKKFLKSQADMFKNCIDTYESIVKKNTH